jgi:hypothetical protein
MVRLAADQLQPKVAWEECKTDGVEISVKLIFGAIWQSQMEWSSASIVGMMQLRI